VSESLGGFARWTIASAVALTCVLFLPSLSDPVNVIKLTVLVLCAIALLIVPLYNTLRDRVLVTAWGAPALSAGLLAGAFVTSAIAAPTAEPAVVGTYGRNSGLLAYLGALVLFIIGLRVWTAANAQLLALALIAGGLFTAAYGLLQYAGIDPINWSNPFNPIIGGLGNPDFASGYLGICAPAAAWGALSTRWARPLRIASATVLVLCLAAAGLSSAIQGPIAAAAGLAVLAATWFIGRGGTVGRRGLVGLGVVAGGGLVLLLAGIAKVGPAKPFFTSFSFHARTWYWQGAVTMFRRHPVVGVGLDHYGDYWRQVRPDASTLRQGGDAFSDAAHSVPMQMLAQGGVVLITAYVLFVGVIAWTLVRGLRTLRGDDLLLVGGLGGAWAAYTVQSLVSIDQVPLLVVQFATAGGIVGVVGARTRSVRLPGALVVPQQQRRRGRAQVERRRDLSGADLGALAVAGCVLLWLAWLSLIPLRANGAARSGDLARARGDGNAALAAYQRANRLLPGASIYWEKTGGLYEDVKQPDLALSTYRTGLRHDPLDVILLRKAASLAAAKPGAKADVRNWLSRAVALDPTNPTTGIQTADFFTTDGQAKRSLPILARLLGLFPDNADLWAQAGRAYAATAEKALASHAFRRALELNPQQPVAVAALKADSKQ
jgi:putative inorganic carbon (HCO3(-)) transporter